MLNILGDDFEVVFLPKYEACHKEADKLNENFIAHGVVELVSFNIAHQNSRHTAR